MLRHQVPSADPPLDEDNVAQQSGRQPTVSIWAEQIDESVQSEAGSDLSRRCDSLGHRRHDRNRATAGSLDRLHRRSNRVDVGIGDRVHPSPECCFYCWLDSFGDIELGDQRSDGAGSRFCEITRIGVVAACECSGHRLDPCQGRRMSEASVGEQILGFCPSLLIVAATS